MRAFRQRSGLGERQSPPETEARQNHHRNQSQTHGQKVDPRQHHQGGGDFPPQPSVGGQTETQAHPESLAQGPSVPIPRQEERRLGQEEAHQALDEGGARIERQDFRQDSLQEELLDDGDSEALRHQVVDDASREREEEAEHQEQGQQHRPAQAPGPASAATECLVGGGAEGGISIQKKGGVPPPFNASGLSGYSMATTFVR